MNRRPQQPREGGRGKFIPRRRVCAFCVDKATIIDYKDIGRLRRFVSDRGRIETRRRSGSCAKHQRALAVAISRARQLALLPFTATHSRDTGAVAPIAPAAPLAPAATATPAAPALVPAPPQQ